ncbi:Uncharacterized protein TCM_026872 [Theobroma cacao]|uniref:Uncharacterized protein n=1 Tax=Theobroma cacao TaxID=3641 RepID=A0A061F564_THECC|nr:Uncharacterized protein TCM_026872 [Theobroma cacao]
MTSYLDSFAFQSCAPLTPIPLFRLFCPRVDNDNSHVSNLLVLCYLIIISNAPVGCFYLTSLDYYTIS